MRCSSALGRAVRRVVATTVAVVALSSTATPASAGLVSLSSDLELLLGPLPAIPATPSWGPAYDALQRTEAARYAISNDNFYDHALALYALYYRTGDPYWRDRAWDVAATTISAGGGVPARSFSTLGLAIRALEGDAAARAVVENHAQLVAHAYLYYQDQRETGYSLIALVAAWILAGRPASDVTPPAQTSPSTAVSVDRLVVTTHQPVRVSWSVTGASGGDWVGFVPAGGAYCCGLRYAYTGGTSSGSADVPAPAPGLYQIRYHGPSGPRPGGPVIRVLGEFDHRANAKLLLDTILARQRSDGRWDAEAGDLVPVPFTLNYMSGLLMEALILYDRAIGDARIVPALQRNLDWTWRTQWVPGAQAFQYADVDAGSVSTTPYANLSGLIAPAWAYVYAKTGASQYLSQGEQIMQGMVNVGGREIWGQKQFTQMFRSSFRYLGYLDGLGGGGGGGGSPPTSTPQLALSSSAVAPGQAVTATLTNGAGGATDWLALAATSSGNTTYLQWTYVGAGVTDRTWTVNVPNAPGSYEIRLFASNGYTRLATSAPISVGAGASLTTNVTSAAPGQSISATLTGGPGGATDWLALASTSSGDTTYLQWTYVGAGVANRTWTVNVPNTPGSYEIRLFANNGYTRLATSAPFSVGAGASVTTNVTSAAPGQSIGVTLTGGPGGTNDWLALAPAGAPDTTYVDWTYVGSGVTDRTWTVAAPSLPGAYEIRLFADNGYTRLATSAAIAVEGGPALTTSTTSAAPGEAVTVTLTGGDGGPTDWLALATEGAPDSSYLTWTYVGAGVTTRAWTVAMPSASGRYVFRLYADNGFDLQTSSAAVTVGGGGK